MAKKVVAEFGKLRIMMDVGTGEGYAARPYVSFVEGGTVKYHHIYLDEVDDLMSGERHEKEAICWLRQHKEELIAEYLRSNP